MRVREALEGKSRPEDRGDLSRAPLPEDLSRALPQARGPAGQEREVESDERPAFLDRPIRNDDSHGRELQGRAKPRDASRPRRRRKTVEHVASAAVETPPEPPEEPPADRVHDEVGAPFESGIEQRFGGSVEPDGFRPEPPAEIELGFRSDQSERPQSPPAGELEESAPTPPAAAVTTSRSPARPSPADSA